MKDEELYKMFSLSESNGGIMIICRSNNQIDIDFAREHGVWQSSRFAKDIQPGELLALQLTGTKDPVVVGRITSEVFETAPYAWPSGDQKYSKTITFEPLDLAGQWSSARK
jgi:hypothetical protein